MRYMNDYDISRAVARHGNHPTLGPAVQTLVNLRDWADSNSDGWAYWPKPCRAAAKLMELIEGDYTNDYDPREHATKAAVRKALAPIKAFRTRQNADFEIVEESE